MSDVTFDSENTNQNRVVDCDQNIEINSMKLGTGGC